MKHVVNLHLLTGCTCDALFLKSIESYDMFLGLAHHVKSAGLFKVTRLCSSTRSASDILPGHLLKTSFISSMHLSEDIFLDSYLEYQ